jgi:hypothetical protein
MMVLVLIWPPSLITVSAQDRQPALTQPAPAPAMSANEAYRQGHDLYEKKNYAEAMRCITGARAGVRTRVKRRAEVTLSARRPAYRSRSMIPATSLDVTDAKPMDQSANDRLAIGSRTINTVFLCRLSRAIFAYSESITSASPSSTWQLRADLTGERRPDEHYTTGNPIFQDD